MEVKDIFKEAFDEVATELQGVVKDAHLTNFTPGDFNPDIGIRQRVPEYRWGRAIIENENAIKNVFPGYIAVGGEKMLLLEGFTLAPKEGSTIELYGGWIKTVVAVLDLLDSGGGYRVIVR